MPVIMEQRLPGAPKWYRHPIPVPEGSTSSFSSQSPEVREVYLMGYRDGIPGLWVSRSGLDIDHQTLIGQLIGIGTFRLTPASEGMDLLSDLRDGPARLVIYKPTKQATQKFEVRISLDATPEDVSLRQTIETMVAEKEQVLLNMYLQMVAFAGRGDEGRKVLEQTIYSLIDHDLRHYWLEEACPCNQPNPN